MSRLQKRQQPEIHRAVPVGKLQRLNVSIIHRGQMNAGTFHQPAAESQPFRTVMVATDGIYLHLQLRQPAQKFVKQSNRFRRRNTFVVNITAEQDGICFFFLDDAKDLLQNVCLILHHGDFVDPLSDVQVR